MDWHTILAYVFFVLFGITVAVYALLDGFDLGVGMLMPRADKEEQNIMVASIGPFWDANETWLVLGVGVLFIVFPDAHALILSELYLAVTLMLCALMVRGVSFDFRVKARLHHQPLWNVSFQAASFGMAATQGWMLGRFVMGFEQSVPAYLFALGITACVPAVYAMLGATWLLAKTEGALQQKARCWAQQAWYLLAACLILVSLATPYVSQSVFDRWFTPAHLTMLAPIPLATAWALWRCRSLLAGEQVLQQGYWRPFALTAVALVLSALGLGISLFPYVVVNQLTVTEAAATTPTLVVTLIGVAVTVPMIIAYSIFAYRVFRGKAAPLVYG